MAERKIKTNVAVFGSGALGLWTAYELTQRKIPVIVLEKEGQLATGSSTRNVRGLRTGAHDLTGRQVSPLARGEAQRARRSFEVVKAIAPGAIRDATPTFNVFFGDADQKTIEERWRAEHIPYQIVKPGDFRRAAPELQVSDISFVAQVQDACIDSRIVFEKLRDEILKGGGTIVTKAELQKGNSDSREALVTIDGQEHIIDANAYVVAAGYGANDIYRTVVDKNNDLPLGYAKAYILGLPRITDSTFLPFGADLPSISTAQTTSLFLYGMTRGLTGPNFAIPDDKKEALYDAAHQIVPQADPRRGEVHACITIDTMPIPGISSDGKSVTYGVWTFGWPGMMTVAPDVASQIVDGLPLLEKAGTSDQIHYVRRPMQPPVVAAYPTEEALRVAVH